MAVSSNIFSIYFTFENGNGTLYRVVLDVLSGAGYGELISVGAGSRAPADNAVTGKAKIALQVDAAALTNLQNRHQSWFIWSPVFNTGKELSQLLTA